MYRKPEVIELDGGLQERSKLWWNENPMSYDWHKTATTPEGSLSFYGEIDRRFFSSSSFYGGQRPFCRLIPFHELKGRRVLEIGCGLGSHAQLLAEAGCKVTAIDLTPRAVELTNKRLSLQGIPADVRLMDAEQMDFEDEEFDFVWSWGVIHHSAGPERIIRQVRRVLRPKGQFRVMVYHRRSLEAYVSIVRGALSGKLFKGMSLEEIRSYYTDGYTAKFYTPFELSDMIRRCGLRTVEIRVLGQKSELLPIPGKGRVGNVKSAALKRIPDSAAEFVLSMAGMFLFAAATKDPRQ
jgi:2-polyprenyl-3-methyl-5-hydroxy-6-metoxy-1,4-benzoquinol methylase